MTASDSLSPSMEDYLEAIFHIVVKKQAARAKDIARRLKVRSSSVTGALQNLAGRDLINYAPYDLVTLTPKGRDVAERIVRKHGVLHDFFVNVLAVDEAEAEKAACRIEHAIPNTVLERLVKFAEFLKICPRGGADWIKEFTRYCDFGRTRDNCEQCVASCLAEARNGKTDNKDDRDDEQAP